MRRGVQTYYGYSLYYLTARECFFHVWLPFPHRFSPDRVDLLALHPILNSPFVTSFFLIQVISFLSEVNNYQIYMASMDWFGFARACDNRRSSMCDENIAWTCCCLLPAVQCGRRRSAWEHTLSDWVLSLIYAPLASRTSHNCRQRGQKTLLLALKNRKFLGWGGEDPQNLMLCPGICEPSGYPKGGAAEIGRGRGALFLGGKLKELHAFFISTALALCGQAQEKPNKTAMHIYKIWRKQIKVEEMRWFSAMMTLFFMELRRIFQW